MSQLKIVESIDFQLRAKAGRSKLDLSESYSQLRCKFIKILTVFLSMSTRHLCRVGIVRHQIQILSNSNPADSAPYPSSLTVWDFRRLKTEEIIFQNVIYLVQNKVICTYRLYKKNRRTSPFLCLLYVAKLIETT